MTIQTTGLFSLFAFGFITNFLSSIPWSLIFLFTQNFGIRLYDIRKREECITIQKNLGVCSHITDGGKGSGYSVGYWYLAHVSSSMDDNAVWLIATTSSYNTLSKEKEVSVSFSFNEKQGPLAIERAPFLVLDRNGSNNNIYYRERSLKLSVKPKIAQQTILDDITHLLAKKKTAVVLLHGPPNVGKTMVSLIVANEIGGRYCNCISPWEPGETIQALYNDSDISEKNPLIIAFDEVDSAIEQIHTGITPHKNIKICVRNKAGWNKMFDEIQKGFYPNIVVVMTTNKPVEFFNTLDTSYMAPHRVDKIYTIEKNMDVPI